MSAGYIFKSKERLLFFARKTGRGAFTLEYDGYLDEDLGENGAPVLRGFIDDGLIEPLPVHAAIDRLFTADELKPHLRARGLRVGGRKPELVARIVAADPAWAGDHASSAGLYRRTTFGQAVADDIYESIGREEGEMEARLLLLIHDRRYEEAFRAMAAWDRPSELRPHSSRGVSKELGDPAGFVELAGYIERGLPAGARERAILSLLYQRGDHAPAERDAVHGAYYERDLRAWMKYPFIIGLRVVGPREASECSSAAAHAGAYRLEDAPDYPFQPCDREPCCSCHWEPVMEDEAEGVQWKEPARRHPLAIERRRNLAHTGPEGAERAGLLDRLRRWFFG